MKKNLLIIAATLIFFCTDSYSQLAFSVSPGVSLNGGHVGYKINNRAVPYIGFQYISGKLTGEETYTNYNYDNSRMETLTTDFSLSGGIYIPTLGCKLFIATKNKVKAYLNANISKPLIKANAEFDGETENEVKNTVEALSIIGGEAGFGAEYFFDENFSVGAEFGLRLIRGKYEDSDTREVYNPETGIEENTPYETTIKANLNPTYSKVSINFYF